MKLETAIRLDAEPGNTNKVKVYQDHNYRYMVIDDCLQGYSFARNPSIPVSKYIRCLMYATSFVENGSALCIGLGPGLLHSELAKSGYDVLSVEKNKDVYDKAVKYFDFDEGFHVETYDAINFVPKAKFDMVFLDAFDGHTPATDLYNREFFNRVKSWLTPSGIFAMNIVSTIASDSGDEWIRVDKELSLSAFRNHDRKFYICQANTKANVLAFVGNPYLGYEDNNNQSEEVKSMLRNKLERDYYND